MESIITQGRASEALTKHSNEGKVDTDLAANYPDRYSVTNKDDGFKYVIQVSDRNKEITTSVDLNGDGEDEEYKVLTRVWKRRKGDDPIAKCYKLIEVNGEQKWIVESTTDEPRYDEETNTNYWKLGNARELDDADTRELMVTLEQLTMAS